MYDEDSARFWGRQREPVYLKLFANNGLNGWIDCVEDHHYPHLEVMKEHLAAFARITEPFIETSFAFARSLDDFGYRR